MSTPEQSTTQTQIENRSASTALYKLIDHGSCRVKEERALIQCRTVAPAATHLAQRSADALQCVIPAPPSASACLGKRTRNGKIARLPKLERDMVNQLLHNHVPYSKDNIPHRNNLPPREEMPYRQPGPTLGDLLGDQLRALAGKPKQLSDAPSNGAQPAVSGSPAVTEQSPAVAHGNSR